jgi:hypothetical protein
VTFHVLGDDGLPLRVDLAVSGDGRTLRGQGQHRALFGLTFTRAER